MITKEEIIITLDVIKNHLRKIRQFLTDVMGKLEENLNKFSFLVLAFLSDTWIIHADEMFTILRHNECKNS